MAVNVSVWQNVAVAMQSALGASQVISSITKANPGVVTYVGADPANGDFIKITAVGMSQVDGRIFRVANVNAGSNTLELEGENTTLFDTFTSGGMEPVTFGTSLATLTNLNASGGDFAFIDVTTIHDTVKKQIPGAANPATYSFDAIWDTADTASIAMKSASDNKAQRAFKITFANAQKLLFLGYVGSTLLPIGSAQDKVTSPVVITMFGRPTVYAT